ncbi:MAG: YhcH/YjgK/YiaL family protein [Ferruginibacter sp.]|nr:YhcH/YjgK/YiaL family protein [Ferruginibacter sp.]
MIIDSIDNAQKYFTVHPLFEKAFAFINSVELANVAPGIYQIDRDNIIAIFSHNKGMSTVESINEFECHHQHIDIQLCIRGKERFGWKPSSSCVAPKGEYDPEKDVLFYGDEPGTYFELTDGQFVIFFPEDVHAPMIAVDDNKIQKLVIKVKI